MARVRSCPESSAMSRRELLFTGCSMSGDEASQGFFNRLCGPDRLSVEARALAGGARSDLRACHD
jgi:hypothetical protein